MLVLTRKLNQTIVIDGNIKVKIVEINDGGVKLGIDAPKTIPVHRQEVFEEIQKENTLAAKVSKNFNLEDL
jgi:carbon storage regulator